MSKTPSALGYRLPGEFERQEATWFSWPHNRNDWPGKFEPIPWVFAEMIRHISQVQRVRLLVHNAKTEKQARDVLKRAGADLKKIDFYSIPTNRGWMRDCGPIFVTQGKRKAMLDWRFNAWAKYPNWKLDNAVPEHIQKHNKLSSFIPFHKGKRVVLEGGAIDVNGKGTILTTEECMLSKMQCRNPGFTREDYERVFADWLGATHTIWLGKGITGDDTHGHVDDLARFVNPSTIVTVVERDRKDANFAPLQDNLKRLKKARDTKGKPFTIVELPMPRPLCFEGVRLPMSYANFLICNRLVLVPTFNDPSDRITLNILAELMPRHEIVGIHAVDLIWGFGTIHCLSQQEPAVM